MINVIKYVCNQGSTITKANCLTCSDDYPYFFFGNCLKSCENGYKNKNGFLECNCVTEECSDCTEDSLNEGLCKECNKGYYQKSDDISYPNNYIKCYKDPPGYYLDDINQIYKPCYSSCKKCYGEGNDEFHNCEICDSKNAFALIKNVSGHESKNCYKNCTYYYYFLNNYKYNCTEKNECPQDFKYLIVELGQCISTPCDNTLLYKKSIGNECYKECPLRISRESEDDPNICIPHCSYDYPFKLIEKEKCVLSCSIMERSKKLCITDYFENRTNLQIQEIIHNDIKRDLLDSFDYTIITENDTITIEENQTIYEIITTKNKNKNPNTTNIDLGECETALKEYYAIEQDEYLYMLKIDAFVEGKTGPMSLYEVYYPLFNSPTLFQLDLSICEGMKINVLYTMELENPELYDKNNPIYNDICSPYSSKNGVDMVLRDVQQEYIDNNKSICDEGCQFGGYNHENNEVECNCDIKESMPPLSEISIDKDKLYKFANIKNVANFGVLKCINLFSIKNRMIHNIGIYSFIPTFITYIICISVFYKVDFKFIKKRKENDERSLEKTHLLFLCKKKIY